MKTMVKSITTEKESGKVYTPDYIVDSILDLSGYCGGDILKKHVIDNSCGDGAFLCQIVKRYCSEFLKVSSDKKLLKKELEKYVHGIEKNRSEQERCIENMSMVAESFGVCDVKWNVLCTDALSVEIFNGKMDYVLGNPPYVRVHNLGESFDEIKKFSFAQNGMTDLYIVFYELGIRMLNKNGILGYITPSSYFSSIAGAYMRKYLCENALLKKVVDLKHFQAFNATTYTAITVLQKNRGSNEVEYYRFDETELKPSYVNTLSQNDYFLSGNFYFAPKEDLELLKKIYCNLGQSDISVKNGYATLCDPVFIHNFEFESQYIIPVVKASKGITQKIFFPYNENGVLVDEEELKKDADMYNYLTENKERLLKRSNEKDRNKYWYAFGRSQAICDTFCDKLGISSLIHNEKDYKCMNVPAGTGIYGGLYVISKTIPLEEIEKSLRSKDFLTFVSLLGKYKSGGYYTFSSKDVKRFLDYKFFYDGGLLC